MRLGLNYRSLGLMTWSLCGAAMISCAGSAKTEGSGPQSGSTSGSGSGGYISTGGAASSSGGGTSISVSTTAQLLPDGGPCVTIASIGAHGVTGSNTGDNGDTQSFIDWLNTQSNASVDTFTTKPTITAGFLAKYDVLVFQWLADVPCTGGQCAASSYWQFSTDEVSALQAWVNNGGGIVTMSGYESSSNEINPINSLLSFTELQYGPDDVLGNCALFDGGSDSLCYCNQGAVPLGPPWAQTAIGADITTVGAFHGRPVLTRGDDTVIDVEDAKYIYGAHQTVGKGHVFVYTDEWVTYSSQWLTVGGDGGPGVQYGNTYDPCYQRSSGQIFQVPQFWFNAITYAASAQNCVFTITQTAQQPPINETIR